MVWQVIAVAFVAGSVGGLASGLLFKPTEKRQYLISYPGKDCPVQFPGLLGNVLLGGVAAVVFWCLYGPFSGATIVGSTVETEAVGLTVGQLATCLLIGMGGAGFLVTEAEKRCLEKRKRGG